MAMQKLLYRTALEDCKAEILPVFSHKWKEPVEKISVHPVDIFVCPFPLTLLEFRVAEDVESAVAIILAAWERAVA